MSCQCQIKSYSIPVSPVSTDNHWHRCMHQRSVDQGHYWVCGLSKHLAGEEGSLHTEYIFRSSYCLLEMGELHDYVFVRHNAGYHAYLRYQKKYPIENVLQIMTSRTILEHHSHLISQKQIKGMESTKFATSLQYSRVQMINISKLWRVEIK